MTLQLSITLSCVVGNAHKERNTRWPGQISIIIESSGNRGEHGDFLSFFFFPPLESNPSQISLVWCVLASQATCKRYRGDGNSRWSSQKTTGSRCGHSRNTKILRPLTRATKPRNSTKDFPFATLYTRTNTRTNSHRGAGRGAQTQTCSNTKTIVQLFRERTTGRNLSKLKVLWVLVTKQLPLCLNRARARS